MDNCVLDGAQAVGDDDPRGFQAFEAAADDLPGAVVEGARGLVEEDDARPVDDGPRDQDALLLPPEKVFAPSETTVCIPWAWP